MNGRASRVVFGIASVAVLALFATPALAAGNCLQARLEESVILPDGSVHAPGVVSICPTAVLNPSVRLCRIAVDGHAMGFWMNRVSEGGRFVADSGTISLRRVPGGGLALADYYWPGKDGRPVAPGLSPTPAPIEPAVDDQGSFAKAFAVQ